MTTRRSRAVLGLARTEAVLLVRNALPVAGLVLSGIVVWAFVHRSQPVWWTADWQIGYGQVVLSLIVLVAAHLATSRVRRDGMDELYTSLPATARTRTVGHLLGQLGALVPGAVLIAASAGYLWSRHVVGQPDAWVLTAGVLLVLSAGMIGVAVGRWFPHPFAGILAAFVWFLPFSQANRLDGPVLWVFPWEVPYELRELPGRLPSYPPGAAHALELSGLALLAAAVAVAAGRIGSWRTRLGVVTAGVVAVAAITTAGVAQYRPIPRSELSGAVTQVVDPAAQQCRTVSAGANTARVCTFPAFAPMAARLDAVVRDVLTAAPSRHKSALLIAQTSQLVLDDPVLAHGQQHSSVTAWAHELDTAPASQPSTTAVYVDLTSWPTVRNQAHARYLVALDVADWALGLPTSAGTPDRPATACAALNQAREAIALWLANHATHTRLRAGVFSPANGFVPIQVAGQSAVGWLPADSDRDYVNAPGTQLTAGGYQLAKAMAAQPPAHVTAVLARQWSRWTDPHTTTAELAAALGIALPPTPSTITAAGGRAFVAPTQQRSRICR